MLRLENLIPLSRSVESALKLIAASAVHIRILLGLIVFRGGGSVSGHY